MANDDFSEPPRPADSKTPIVILCWIMGHLRGPGVSLGRILGGPSIEPFLEGSSHRAVSTPPPHRKPAHPGCSLKGDNGISVPLLTTTCCPPPPPPLQPKESWPPTPPHYQRHTTSATDGSRRCGVLNSPPPTRVASVPRTQVCITQHTSPDHSPRITCFNSVKRTPCPRSAHSPATLT